MSDVRYPDFIHKTMEDWLALRVGSGGFARLCTALLCATVAGAPLKAAPNHSSSG